VVNVIRIGARQLQAVPDLPIDLSLGAQDPRGPSKTVVGIESMAGI